MVLRVAGLPVWVGPSDVVAGLLMGVVWLGATLVAFRKVENASL